MEMAKEEKALYVRNRRPNRVVIPAVAGGPRHLLERRGSREDSVALPAEVENHPTISRWIKTGILEKISKDAFMRLGARTIDVEPNQYLERRIRNNPRGELAMRPAEADSTKSLTQIVDTDVHKAAIPHVEWAGELMSTDEEIESMPELFESGGGEKNYPSRHRGDQEERRRQMGY